MARWFKWAAGLGIAVALLAAIAWRIPAVQDRIVRAAIERQVAKRSDALFADDALRVVLCGTGSPLPHRTRAKACVAVFAAGRFWVVDTGPGSWNRMALLGVDATRIGGVMFTHYHSDHIGDLGEFNLNTWATGRDAPLRVFGGPGVERVVAGFNEAYALDRGYRVAHHGADFLPPDRGLMVAVPIPALVESDDRLVFLKQDGLEISAFAVHHDPIKPAYGYRFDYRGRSVVVTGDTTKSDAVVRAAKGSDVLLHEAQANHLIAMIGESAAAAGRPRVAKVMADIRSYHTTPVEAAEVANAAGVKLLVLYHLNPPPPSSLVEGVFTRGVSDVRAKDWMTADDGLLIELPAGSDAVRTRQLD
ncbi:MAG TPA: MBL fold metallo-hydrolase [Myxococcota bacterium]|nr:MBL fold metallo-hydrolase [Myxococcota bacterium]